MVAMKDDAEHAHDERCLATRRYGGRLKYMDSGRLNRERENLFCLEGTARAVLPGTGLVNTCASSEKRWTR